MRETEKIWMNGELVDWADARIHVGAHGLHYGSGVFEGIRAYETDRGSAVFRLTDHLQRLRNSARLLHMELPFSVEELRASCHELIAANGLPECYLRPIAFFGYGELGVSALGNPVDVVLRHADGTTDEITTTHTMSDEHIEWFRAGAALNILAKK